MSHKHKHRVHKKKWRTKVSTPPVTPPAPPTPPTPPETPQQAIETVATDIAGDIAAGENAINTGIDPIWAQARAEYDALEPAAQARVHQALNDIETAFSVSLGAFHTAFGAKKK
jgi:hypothetical protein